MLALIPDPSVVTHAGPVHALPRITALIAGLGHGGAFRVEHEVQHHKHSQVRSQRVPGAPPGRPGPGAQMDPPDIIHDGIWRVRVFLRSTGCFFHSVRRCAVISRLSGSLPVPEDAGKQ